MSEENKNELEEDQIEEIIVEIANEEDFDQEDLTKTQMDFLEILRNRINIDSGAIDSRQGKVWDLIEVMLVTMMTSYIKLANAKTIEDVNASVKDYEPFFTVLLGKIGSGELSLVHQTKGLDANQVVNEAVESMQKIANVFKLAQKGELSDK